MKSLGEEDVTILSGLAVDESDAKMMNSMVFEFWMLDRVHMDERWCSLCILLLAFLG